jgi:hypothetical protein
MLLAQISPRITAAVHDTSLSQLERTYSAFIADYSDAVRRPALLDLDQPSPTTNVVSLTRA